jgi:hypothetical protein
LTYDWEYACISLKKAEKEGICYSENPKNSKAGTDECSYCDWGYKSLEDIDEEEQGGECENDPSLQEDFALMDSYSEGEDQVSFEDVDMFLEDKGGDGPQDMPHEFICVIKSIIYDGIFENQKYVNGQNFVEFICGEFMDQMDNNVDDIIAK